MTFLDESIYIFRFGVINMTIFSYEDVFKTMSNLMGFFVYFRNSSQTGKIAAQNQSMTHREYCLRADVNTSTNQIEFGILAYFDKIDPLPTKYFLSAACKHFG